MDDHHVNYGLQLRKGTEWHVWFVEEYGRRSKSCESRIGAGEDETTINKHDFRPKIHSGLIVASSLDNRLP
jgi:hypothetical protein